MKQPVHFRHKMLKSDLTVPQMRMALAEVLEAAQEDASLVVAAHHILLAVDALDSVRAIALAVMEEADAEVAPTARVRVAPRKWC